MYIDITQTLPNGAVNPNFKHPYTEFWDYQNLRWYELRSVRAEMAYVKQTPIGKLQLAALAGDNYQRQEKRSYLYLRLRCRASARTHATGMPARTTPRCGTGSTSTRAAAISTTPTWVPPHACRNQDGTHAGTVTPTHVLDASRKRTNSGEQHQPKFKLHGVMGGRQNFSLFHDRLVLIGAYRRDLTDLRTRNTLNPGDYPTGWDGSQIIFKPDAPADWSTLTYLPKNAAGQVTGPCPAG